MPAPELKRSATPKQSFRSRVGGYLGGKLGIPSAADQTLSVAQQENCQTALDLGCGVSSHLSALRPEIKTFGIDADPGSIEEARANNVHDGYALADIVQTPIEDLRAILQEAVGQTQFDIVTAYGVIEHLTKRDGWELLEKCEALSCKYVLLETPNGFVPQGPEFGNPLQRHLSGWFPNDFRGVGYTVYGSTGTKYLRGYMGSARLPIPGTLLFDQVVLSRVLRSVSAPQHAFNLVAVKDTRGVPARYATREGFRAKQLAA